MSGGNEFCARASLLTFPPHNHPLTNLRVLRLPMGVHHINPGRPKPKKACQPPHADLPWWRGLFYIFDTFVLVLITSMLIMGMAPTAGVGHVLTLVKVLEGFFGIEGWGFPRPPPSSPPPPSPPLPLPPSRVDLPPYAQQILRFGGWGTELLKV